MKSFMNFLYTLYLQKYIIGQLVKRDFQNKYLASYVGLPWAFIQPGATVFVMWFAHTALPVLFILWHWIPGTHSSDYFGWVLSIEGF